MIPFPDIRNEKIQPAIKPHQRVKKRAAWGSGKETHRQGWKWVGLASKAVPPRTCSPGDNTALLSKILITLPGFQARPLGGRGTTWCGDLHWIKSARDKEPQDQKKAKAFQCPKIKPEPQTIQQRTVSP